MELSAADIAKEEGYSAALKGDWRACPSGKYKVISVEMNAWYEGFDCATKGNHNPKLTKKFSLRR